MLELRKFIVRFLIWEDPAAQIKSKPDITVEAIFGGAASMMVFHQMEGPPNG